jgi:hypothetical protein
VLLAKALGAVRQQPATSGARAEGVQWGTDDENRLRLLAPEVNGEHEAVVLGEMVVLQPNAVRQEPGERWMQVQRNPMYRAGALTEAEGVKIRWHSPSSEQSSQVLRVRVRFLAPLGGRSGDSAETSDPLFSECWPPWPGGARAGALRFVAIVNVAILIRSTTIA